MVARITTLSPCVMTSSTSKARSANASRSQAIVSRPPDPGRPARGGLVVQVVLGEELPGRVEVALLVHAAEVLEDDIGGVGHGGPPFLGRGQRGAAPA